jgi:glucans biosynthesis protein
MSSIPDTREPATAADAVPMPWDVFTELPHRQLCGVWTKAGTRCRKMVVPGRARCRSHGGAAGAPFGPRNGNWKTGEYSQAAKLEVREANAELRRLYKMGQEIGLFPKRGRGRKRPAKPVAE